MPLVVTVILQSDGKVTVTLLAQETAWYTDLSDVPVVVPLDELLELLELPELLLEPPHANNSAEIAMLLAAKHIILRNDEIFMMFYLDKQSLIWAVGAIKFKLKFESNSLNTPCTLF